MNQEFITAILAFAIVYLAVFQTLHAVRRRRVTQALQGTLIAVVFAVLCMDRLLVGLMVELANVSIR